MIANLNNSEDFIKAKIPASNLQSSVLKEHSRISPCGFCAFARAGLSRRATLSQEGSLEIAESHRIGMRCEISSAS